MKVLLVEPPVSPFDIPTKVFARPPPHHLESLAGPLIPYHDVRIFDMRIDDDLKTELAVFQPDVVGCSCVAANSHLAKGVLEQAKVYNPEIVTVIGGHHPSLMPGDCNEPFIDATVIGEGEETLRDLVRGVERRGWTDIQGIAYRGGDGTQVINPLRALADLDALPIPERRLTERYRRRGRYFRASWRPLDCIISSRGCPYRCTFCGLWKINRGRYRYRDPERIADERETIDAPYVAFIDDNTLDSIQKASKWAS